MPSEALPAHYLSKGERESTVRALAAKFRVPGTWQYEELKIQTERDSPGRFLVHARLREPTFGYECAGGNAIKVTLDQFLGRVSQVSLLTNRTIVPPPPDPVSIDRALDLAREHVQRERESLARRLQGGRSPSFDWPGDEEVRRSHRLHYVEPYPGDWSSERGRTWAKQVRLAYSFQATNCTVTIDAETGEVIGGGSTEGTPLPSEPAANPGQSGGAQLQTGADRRVWLWVGLGLAAVAAWLMLRAVSKSSG
ncbi:MAG: hypothetical protein AB7F50_07285 [Fimbriimonadaceae bacterium]